MTRVLVAGAAGFIGRHVVDELLAATDWDIVGTARSRPGPDIDSKRVSWVRGDLTITHAAAQLTEVVGEVQYVVNLAADADAARSLDAAGKVVSNNVGAAVALLEYARALPDLQRFIQVSSAEVFGTLPWEHTEEDPAWPQTPYAASKGAQDLLAIAYREAHQVPVLISHTVNVFGPGQPSTKLLPVLVDRLRHGQPLEVIEGERRFIHARDCASAWVWMLRHAPRTWSHCNVAGDWRISHSRFARLVARAAGQPDAPITTRGNGRPGQQGDVLLDGTRLAEAGWQHPFGVERGVQQTVDALMAAA